VLKVLLTVKSQPTSRDRMPQDGSMQRNAYNV